MSWDGELHTGTMLEFQKQVVAELNSDILQVINQAFSGNKALVTALRNNLPVLLGIVFSQQRDEKLFKIIEIENKEQVKNFNFRTPKKMIKWLRSFSKDSHTVADLISVFDKKMEKEDFSKLLKAQEIGTKIFFKSPNGEIEEVKFYGIHGSTVSFKVARFGNAKLSANIKNFSLTNDGFLSE